MFLYCCVVYVQQYLQECVKAFDQQYVFSDDGRFCNADKTGHDTCSEAIFNCCCICCLQPDSAGDCGESRFFEQARYCLRHYRSRSCWFRIYFWYKGLWCDQLDQHCGYWFSAFRISKDYFCVFCSSYAV